MNDRLHPLLVVLCLFDLGFVHSTHAVDAMLLLPMWALAFASPWLRRLQRFAAYRAIWNVGVLIVFSLLVRHATTTGLLHMLEDGLVLAVLCQVHLLNNVGERQRPDLTFFNSFLIAFVTSLFAPSFWWSLLFIGHTLAFVPALQVYVLTGSGHDISKKALRTMMRDSIPRTLIISAVTAVAFVFWPRDFERKGWLKETLALAQLSQGGLAESIDLGHKVRPFLSDEIALRIEMVEGRLSDVPCHWRAMVFSRFDGRTWEPQEVGRQGNRQLASRFASDSQWQRQANGSWRRPARGEPHTRMRVQQFDRDTDRLVTTLAAVHLTPTDLRGCMLNPESYAGFGIVPAADAPVAPLAYTIELAQPQPARVLSERTRSHFMALPDDVPDIVSALSEQIRGTLPSSADGLAYATAVSNWLQANRRYDLPGNPGFAENLGEFLLGTATGQCEYFATTMALLLRTQGVPCRVVGGYLVHEESKDHKAMIARGRDAHAWIEVLARDGSWHTFDATPAADVTQTGQGEGYWYDASMWMQSLWNEVTGFDDKRRARWVASLLSLPLRYPLITFALPLAFLWLRRRRRHAQRQPAITNFEQALRQAKLTLLPGETPREILVRASSLDLTAEQLAAMQAAALEHERSRYQQA